VYEYLASSILIYISQLLDIFNSKQSLTVSSRVYALCNYMVQIFPLSKVCSSQVHVEISSSTP
jgi:hypothetical protein